MQLFSKIKQWVTWQIASPKILKFIDINCHALLEEFPDLAYLEFKFKGKVFRFEQAGSAQVVESNNNLSKKEGF
jgi:hypothetical protein